MASKTTREFVTKVVTEANEMFAKSICSEDRRQGQIDVISKLLMDAKMYKGFTYLMQDQVPAGELPGIFVNGTIEDTPVALRFAAGKVDSTRVRFFV